MLRSNSAREQKIWKISFSLLVVVSMLSVRLANPMSLALRSSTTSIRCLRKRPKWSSRHTTRVSPLRSCSRALEPLTRARFYGNSGFQGCFDMLTFQVVSIFFTLMPLPSRVNVSDCAKSPLRYQSRHWLTGTRIFLLQCYDKLAVVFSYQE